MNRRQRRSYLPAFDPSRRPGPSKVVEYSGDPATLLDGAAQQMRHAFEIVNGMAQQGDGIAAKAVQPLLEAMQRVNGAIKGIRRADAVLPDAEALGRLD